MLPFVFYSYCCCRKLFNKIKHEKVMSYINIYSTNFFSINILQRLDLRQNCYLRCQLSFFAPLENIRLHRYDSFFRFILLLWSSTNVNPYLTTLNKISIPSNKIPFHNRNEPTTTSERNSSDCHILHDNLKRKIFRKKRWHIFHMNINSLLPKIDEISFIAK